MIRIVLIAAVSLVLTACDAEDVTQLMNTGKKTNDLATLEVSPKQYDRGAILFNNNCAACHGEQAQGAVNWQKRNKDGKFPPPPLNGTGHTWHHPTKILKYTINNGTGKIGGNMPAFAGKLSDTEIDDILIFIQSKWPVQLYDTWYKSNQRSIKEKNK